jgi:hypothetical protein
MPGPFFVAAAPRARAGERPELFPRLESALSESMVVGAWCLLASFQATDGTITFGWTPSLIVAASHPPGRRAAWLRASRPMSPDFEATCRGLS